MKRLALMLLLVASTAYAEMYTWTDSKGTTHYVSSQYDIPARYRSRAKVYDVATGKKLPISAAAAAAPPSAPAGGAAAQPPQLPAQPQAVQPLPAQPALAPVAPQAQQSAPPQIQPQPLPQRGQPRARHSRGAADEE
ncbi:DUF4124 domain-containing protein [Geomonas sp. RF6]|uniref:DUF4124 domain-containing protein n=1 Tax=Geomonas sp. RF6 TaxID=2897342 RepID=UPI001E4D3F42|nr:DUF4124 domain-containing protein [Geomonas sp. RF6]UFS72564.1 DUF4124 domain-containing protein [Geomonas sp. RF6]